MKSHVADPRVQHATFRLLSVGVKGDLIYFCQSIGLKSLGADQRVALSASCVFAIVRVSLLNSHSVVEDTLPAAASAGPSSVSRASSGQEIYCEGALCCNKANCRSRLAQSSHSWLERSDCVG